MAENKSVYNDWDMRPIRELSRFELRCNRCGTGIEVEKREDLERPCPWCSNPNMAVYERIR